MKIFYLTLSLFIIVVFSGCGNISLTENGKLDQKCKELSKEYITKQEEKYDDDYNFIKTTAFYSEALNTCVLTEEGEIENYFNILDIKQNFLKDTKSLYYCDEAGVDNAILDKVREYDGYVFTVSYKEWLDNMEGGLPRTLETPAAKYTKEKCSELFNRKITEIK